MLVAAQPGLAYTGDIAPAIDVNPDLNIFETTLIADETMIDLTGSGPLAHLFAFNGMVPGPEIRVKVGDRVIVHVQNQLDEALTIHWHGIELNNLSDGTTVTQNPILPNGTFDYDFIVRRPGAFWYHPHVMPTDQVFRGLYGPLIVRSDAEAILEAEGVLPATVKTLVLSDTTMCVDVGIESPLAPQCLG